MNNITNFEVGQIVKAVNLLPLEGKKVAPPLEELVEYTVNEIILDKKGNQHLDIGLLSEYNYISSFETGEELERGDKIHWCHPSRFILA